MKVKTLQKWSLSATLAPLATVAVGTILQFVFHVPHALAVGLYGGLLLWVTRFPLESRLKRIEGFYDAFVQARQEEKKRAFIRRVLSDINPTSTVRDELQWFLEEWGADAFPLDDDELDALDAEVQTYNLEEMEYQEALRLVRRLKFKNYNEA